MVDLAIGKSEREIEWREASWWCLPQWREKEGGAWAGRLLLALNGEGEGSEVAGGVGEKEVEGRERGAAGGRRLERRQGAGLELLLAVRARWRSTATTT